MAEFFIAHSCTRVAAGVTSLAYAEVVGWTNPGYVLKLQPYCLGLPLGALENLKIREFMASHLLPYDMSSIGLNHEILLLSAPQNGNLV